MYSKEVLPITYRLTQQTSGTIAGSKHRTLVVAPAGSVVTLVGPLVEESDFVEIQWNGQSLQVFAADFRQRAEQVGLETDSEILDSPALKETTEISKPASPPVKIRKFNAAGRELNAD